MNDVNDAPLENWKKNIDLGSLKPVMVTKTLNIFELLLSFINVSS
jgi:hypothetical protein